MNIDVLVNFEVRISNHDGYCSGNECELEINQYTKLIKNVPKEKYINDYVKYANSVEIFNHGSGYCYLNKDCSDIGLQRHDYHISVIWIIVNPKFKYSTDTISDDEAEDDEYDIQSDK